MRFPREFIEEVKSQSNIIEIAQMYTSLEKAGDNIWKGPCPNSDQHAQGDDSDPSFTVYEHTQSFYCYGCGAGSKEAGTQGSDVVGLLCWIEGYTFEQAIIKLAERASLPLSVENMRDLEEVNRLRYIANAQADIYHETLLKDENMIRYLKDRGLDDNDISEWKLGKVPQTSQFEHYRNRLAFPVFDVYGRPIGFGFRAMQGESPKYINNPENMIWHKGRVLYGLHKARKPILDKKHAILCEGFTDVILLHKYGIDNAVACMGTSLTDSQVNLIRSYTKEVIIFIDGDSPGEEAASRQIQKLRNAGLVVSVVPTYPGLDPADIANEIKDNLHYHIVENVVIWSQFEIGKILNKYNSEWIKLRLETMDKIEPILSQLTDVERGMYMNIIKDILEVRPWNEQQGNMARTIRDIARVRQ